MKIRFCNKVLLFAMLLVGTQPDFILARGAAAVRSASSPAKTAPVTRSSPIPKSTVVNKATPPVDSATKARVTNTNSSAGQTSFLGWLNKPQTSPVAQPAQQNSSATVPLDNAVKAREANVKADSGKASFGKWFGGSSKEEPKRSYKPTPQLAETRELRAKIVYQSKPATKIYIVPTTRIVYQDRWDDYYLAHVSIDWWAHHLYDVDRARFSEARFRELERQVAEMRARPGFQVNSSFRESGIDEDLAYRKDVAYEESGHSFCFWLFVCSIVAGILFLLYKYKQYKSEMRRAY